MKNSSTDDDDDFIAFPTMPCTSAPNNIHRTKVPPDGLGGKLFNAMVSRPVGRAEIESNPKAKEAMLKEWKGLRDQEVFDFSMVREYDDVVAEAKKDKKEIHMARVHGICVEKNYQLPESNPGRKFKGRGVLLGNQVKNQHWEAAFFQDLGNSPASFEASRWADFFGCLPGHSVKLADAIQAYIQAKLKGPLCWVELPTDAWPPEIQYWKYRRPVVRLDKALYGHPDSGTMWEQHCDKKVQEIGFKPIGEEWPSMYFHDKLKLLLVIYVDDLKLAGPSENLAKGWEMLRTVLRIEPETDLGLYLGCVLSQGETQLHNGKQVKTITYNMEGWLKLSVESTPYECHQTSKIHDLLEHFQECIDNFDDLDEIGQKSRRVYLDGESGFEVSVDDQGDSQHIKKLKVKKKRKAGNRRRKTASPGEEIPSDDEGCPPGTPYDGPLDGEETDLEDEGHGVPEEVAEGDEDDIEVDVVEGESRVAKRGTLKREANSLNQQIDSQIQESIL